VGVKPTDELTLELPQAACDWGKQFSDTVLIQTTGSYSPYKNWPVDRWHGLAKLIQHELKIPVKQVGSKQDLRVEGVDLIDSPDIHHALAAVKNCRLFIGIDSVFNHASQAFKKPALILWGSTNPLAFGYLQNVNLVNSVLWNPTMGNEGPLMRCQPCYKEYRHMGEETLNMKPRCTHTIPYPVHVLPKSIHPRSELHACMAANTIANVFYYASAMLHNQAKAHQEN
jgi:hypothetical protein